MSLDLTCKLGIFIVYYIIMAFKYRIYKQLIPAPLNDNDPTWARRQVWVAKINSEDTIDEYATVEDARTQKTTLSTADSSGRVYKITKMLGAEVGERVTSDNTKAEIAAYMDDNGIDYASGDTKDTLLTKVEDYWNTPNEDVE